MLPLQGVRRCMPRRVPLSTVVRAQKGPDYQIATKVRQEAIAGWHIARERQPARQQLLVQLASLASPGPRLLPLPLGPLGPFGPRVVSVPIQRPSVEPAA